MRSIQCKLLSDGRLLVAEGDSESAMSEVTYAAAFIVGEFHQYVDEWEIFMCCEDCNALIIEYFYVFLDQTRHSARSFDASPVTCSSDCIVASSSSHGGAGSFQSDGIGLGTAPASRKGISLLRSFFNRFIIFI